MIYYEPPFTSATMKKQDVAPLPACPKISSGCWRSIGLIIDAHHAPREIQEEAYRLGLIPYIPGDKE